jgi:hypothetical protein
MNILIEKNVIVPMRDGVKLAADVYRPAEGGPFPVIVQRLPYNKDLPAITMLLMDIFRVVQAGYVMVMQDTRGQFAAEGKFLNGKLVLRYAHFKGMQEIVPRSPQAKIAIQPESKRYQVIRRQHAKAERKLAAHRKSLHGKLAHAIVRVGNRIQIEKTSFTGWQKQYGRSIGLRAPGLFVAHLTRIVAKTGGTLTEVSTFKTKLSQYCHQCGQYRKKLRSERWHRCPCGLGPVQRDLYSAFLLAHLEPDQTIPSITRHVWEGAEPRLRAVMEGLQQRANEGQTLPRSMGLSASGKAARAGARRLESPAYPRQEPLSPQRERGSVG